MVDVARSGTQRGRVATLSFGGVPKSDRFPTDRNAGMGGVAWLCAFRAGSPGARRALHNNPRPLDVSR